MSELLATIEPLADLWAASLWRASWQGAVVLAIAWAIARWCTFLSPRIVCWIWRLACLKLLVAFVWIQPIAIPVLPGSPLRVASVETLRPDRPQSETRLMTPRADGNTIRPGDRFTASRILLPLWLTGLFYCIIITVREWSSVRGLCRADELASSVELRKMLRQEADRLAVRWLPRLRVSPRVDGPLLAGIWRPTIVLPDGALESFDESELRLMLSHELGHLKRRDLLWNWLPTVITWLFFFHPLVWLLKRRWSEAQEAACDELLIQNHAACPPEYGRLLVKLSACWPLEPRAALASAGVLGAYRNLERRILAMTRVRRFSPRRMMIAAGILSLIGAPSIIPWRLVAQEVNSAQARASSMNQLKILGIALHIYHDALKSFPLPAIADANGKPLLSWRVALLPYFEQDDCKNLYKQFHLDEPWDSAHNYPLAAKMPSVYRCPASKKADSGMTVYLAPRGPSTVFPGSEPISLRKITDGTSNTIFVVEVNDEHAVPWSKPDDWILNSDDPANGLGGHFKGVILTLFCDGSAHALTDTAPKDVLRALFTRNGGEIVVIPHPTGPPSKLNEDATLHLFLRRDKAGEVVLYLNDKPTNKTSLRSLLGSDAQSNNKLATFLAADKGISYGEVVKVIDMLGSLGLKKISLDTQNNP